LSHQLAAVSHFPVPSVQLLVRPVTVPLFWKVE